MSVVLIAICVICIFGLLIGLLGVMCKNKYIKSKIDGLIKKIFFNMFIKSFLTAFLELALTNCTLFYDASQVKESKKDKSLLISIMVMIVFIAIIVG